MQSPADLDEEETTLTDTRAPDLAEGCAVVIHHRSGVDVVPLTVGQRVVVGRGHQAKVRVDSPMMSRMHATFEIKPSGLLVTDLGSHNGTMVMGRRVKEATLNIGELFDMADVTCQVVSLADARLRGQVITHDDFMKELAAEVEAAREGLKSFAVAMLRLRSPSGEKSGGVRTWAARVRKVLRTVDRVAVFGPGWVEALFKGATLDEALLLGRQLARESRASDEEVVLCGVASFPDSATSPEALLRLAEGAALEATPAQPVVRALPYASPIGMEEMIGASEEMTELSATIRRIARAAVPVLVLGETGSGKEVVARALHRHSPRAAGPFRAVNCGGIAPTLLEGVLFGHEKGAFTGADREQKGVFEEAHKGTLFLDEIGELSAQGQAALLRVLETGRFCRLGSMQERTADVRLVAATHRDLQQKVQEGTFREDLYFRLETVALRVPPLRSRGSDVRLLANKFLAEARATHGAAVEGFSSEALTLLQRYSWPGNVRELRNVVTRAALLAAATLIVPQDLGDRFTALKPPPRIPVKTMDSLPPVPDVASLARTLDGGAATHPGAEGAHKARMLAAEREMLLAALKAENWNQSAAARKLNIPRRTLAYRMRVLGLRGDGEA